MKLVSIVTITSEIKLFSKVRPARNLKKVVLDNGYEVVVSKLDYNVGDKVVFFAPNCVVDSTQTIFQKYTKPGRTLGPKLVDFMGDFMRVKTVQYPLSLEPNGSHVFSRGLVLPYEKVREFLNVEVLDNLSLEFLLSVHSVTEMLGDGETFLQGNTYLKENERQPDLVSFEDISNSLVFPLKMKGFMKHEGREMSITITKDDVSICSDRYKKETVVKKFSHFRKPTFIEYFKVLFHIGDIPDVRVFVTEENKSKYVQAVMPLMEGFKELREKYGQDITLRGTMTEEIGKYFYKLNRKEVPSFVLHSSLTKTSFSVDYAEESYREFIETVNTIKNKSESLYVAEEIFDTEFESKEHFLDICNQKFSEWKDTVEGIMVKDEYGKSFVVYNPFYDLE